MQIGQSESNRRSISHESVGVIADCEDDALDDVLSCRLFSKFFPRDGSDANDMYNRLNTTLDPMAL